MGLAHLSSEESVRSERERAALAVVADGGFDAGLGRRRLVDLPVMAAVPGEHAERQHHLRLPTSEPISPTRVCGAWTGSRRVGVRAEHRRDGARRSGLANPRSRDAVAAEDQGRRGTFRPGHTCPRRSYGDRRCRHGEDGSFPWMLLLTIELSAVVAWSQSRHGNQRLTVATSAAWWLCCGLRRPLVPYNNRGVCGHDHLQRARSGHPSQMASAVVVGSRRHRVKITVSFLG